MPEELSKRVSRLAHHWAFRSVAVGVGLTLATTAIYFSWASQPPKRAKVGEIVSASPQQFVAVNGRPVQPGAEITIGQQLTTSQDSKAVLQQADQIFARLGTSSAATLERSCVQLNEGQMVVSSTQGCLGAIVIQNSSKEDAIYVVERLGPVGQIKVLAGQIQISLPSNQTVQSVPLASNQKVTLSLTGDDVGPVRLMLPSEVAGILQGELFRGFQQPLANQSLIAGLPANTPPKEAPVQKPAPATVESPPPAQPVKPPVPETALAPTHENSVRPVSAPRHAIQYEEAERDRAVEKPAKDYSSYEQLPRRRRVYDRSYEQFAYRKRTRSPYVASSYRRRTPSYSLPSYSPPSSPPSYSPPTSPPVKQAPPVAEIPHPVEVPPPVMELPPEMPLEPAPVLEPLPPPVMVEPPLEEPHP